MSDSLQSAISTVSSFKFKATETLTDNGSTPAATATNRKPVYSAWDTEETINADSTPALTWDARTIVTLSGGSATLDLTSFTDTQGRARDATGLKLVYIRVYNPGSNSVNIAPGATNAFTEMFGSGNDIDLDAGEEFSKRVRSGNANPNAAVSSTVKDIDFAGSGSDTFLVSLGMGT